MVKTEIYSIKQVDVWGNQLKDLAKKPRTRFSKKQVVEALIDEIEEALEAHSYEEVAENMKEWGLDIAAGSLKQYVNGCRREQHEGTDKFTRKRPSSKSRNKLRKPTEAPIQNKTEAATEKHHGNASLDTDKQSTQGDSGQARATSRESTRAKRRFTEMPEEL